MTPIKEPTLPGKVTALAEALEKARIPYAFGGAIAFAYYATPRATADIDLNVFVGPADFDRVAKTLGRLGVDVSVDRELLERQTQCRLRWGRTPIDLFLSNVEFHDVMQRGARRQPFGDGTIRVLAPEHLAVCKVLFDRPKDWIDLEQMVLTMPELDVAAIEGRLVEMLGRDRRVGRFRKLAAS